MTLSTARVIGFFSLPAATLAEANPSAYNLAMATAPEGAGTCAHCGTGIVHHVQIELADGSRAFIGTTCALKVGSPAMVRAVKARKTAEQIEREDAEREARMAESAQQRAECEARHAAKLARRAQEWAGEIAALKAEGDDFHKSLAEQLTHGSLSPRQIRYVLKAVYGRQTKANQDAYNDLEERLFADEE